MSFCQEFKDFKAIQCTLWMIFVTLGLLLLSAYFLSSLVNLNYQQTKKVKDYHL